MFVELSYTVEYGFIHLSKVIFTAGDAKKKASTINSRRSSQKAGSANCILSMGRDWSCILLCQWQ